MAMSLQTDKALPNQRRINKLGLKEITLLSNCPVFYSNHLGLA